MIKTKKRNDPGSLVFFFLFPCPFLRCPPPPPNKKNSIIYFTFNLLTSAKIIIPKQTTEKGKRREGRESGVKREEVLSPHFLPVVLFSLHGEEIRLSLFLHARFPLTSCLLDDSMETSFFQGHEASARPPAAVESLPALHLLERGGIMTTADEVSPQIDLATSGRRHSSLDSARSTVPGRGSMQQVRDREGEATRERV